MAAPLTRRLLYSLIPVVVLGIGGEVGLRVAGWPTPDGAFAHNEPFWVTDPDLRESPFPHQEEGTTFAVTTDDNGLRAPIHAEEKGEGTTRVMTLGCSTTFGWGVGDGESYPAVLEGLARAAGHPKVEVINGGQPGYTSFQGLWLWEGVLRRYAPDVVLVGYIVQDSRKAAYSDRSQAVLQQDARYLKDHVLYRLRTYQALRALLGGLQVRAKERGDGSEGGEYRVPPKDYADNLRAFVDRIREVGATPVLFGYPLERSGYTEGHRRILAAAAEELQVPLFDPQDRMTAATANAQLYFTHDRGHANAAGNAQIAHWVFEFLQANDLLGGA